MPALNKNQAVQKLADFVAKAKPTAIAEYYSELFPDHAVPENLSGAGLARQIQAGLEAEEIVDLWNVVFPADWNVWYDEEQEKIHYNEESLGYAEAE